MGGTIAQFVFLLQSNMRIFDPLEGRNVSAPDTPPVLDQTGLEGDFDILLKTDTHEDWPAIVEHQLGLKLELRKVPVEMLVIESASKPAEN
jgi:uncharacterized protein (TIGR03435 family)